MFFPLAVRHCRIHLPHFKRIVVSQKQRAIVTGCCICCNYIFHSRTDGVLFRRERKTNVVLVSHKFRSYRSGCDSIFPPN